MARNTVALTGATGFVGSTLARRLDAAGHYVRALVRRPIDRAAYPGVEAVSGSLENEASLRRLVGGADAVVHCAGAVRGVSPADFDSVNVDGVERLARVAVEQASPPRFLSLSSLAAREPRLSHYAASKCSGEQVLAAVAAHEMAWTVLRPPAVYGPGDKELLPLFRAMAHGIAPVLGPANARVSLLYVDDLAAAVVKWLDCGGAAGVYELHDGHAGGYTWDEVIDTSARLHARHIVRVRVPAFALRVPAAMAVLAARISGRAPMLTPGKVRELRHRDWVCDNSAFSHATGWVPQISLEEGLRRVAQGIGSLGATRGLNNRCC